MALIATKTRAKIPGAIYAPRSWPNSSRVQPTLFDYDCTLTKLRRPSSADRPGAEADSRRPQAGCANCNLLHVSNSGNGEKSSRLRQGGRRSCKAQPCEHGVETSPVDIVHRGSPSSSIFRRDVRCRWMRLSLMFWYMKLVTISDFPMRICG
jgi:hypothetical protein